MKKSAQSAGGGKKAKYRQLQVIQVKLKKGKNRIKLDKKLAKAGYRVTLRVVTPAKGGKGKPKKGRPLVIQ